VKVPALRRPRQRPATVAATGASALAVPMSTAPSTDASPPPQLPAPVPNPSVPVVYETLRQDATGGMSQPENAYLLPEVEQAQSAQPVDLNELLANQRMNAAAESSSNGAMMVEEDMVGSQLLGVVKNVCRPPCAVYYGDVNVTEPMAQSSQQSLYTNMSRAKAPGSSTTLEASTANSTVFAAASSDTSTAEDAGSPRRPSVPVLSSVAGPSPCRSVVSPSSTYRLPSYEESILSNTASLSLTPDASVSSPLLLFEETMVEAAPIASAVPSYDSPPAYASDKLLELNANTPLKSRQVQQLQDEMANAAGIRVQLDKTQCAKALALIDCFGRVW